jgi:hypothetical protein
LGRPRKGGSEALLLHQRIISSEYSAAKLVQKFAMNYRKSPFFLETMDLIERVVNYPDHNLFYFISNSISSVLKHLNIATPLLVSSSIPTDQNLKGQDRVVAICNALNAKNYLNPIGGIDLYNEEAFTSQGCTLSFIQSRLSSYEQNSETFIPALSIIDVLFSIGKKATAAMIVSDYEIISDSNNFN